MKKPDYGKRRESAEGYSFFNEFNDCPRKFYLRRTIGLMSKTMGSQLINGIAVHAGKARFYKRDGDVDGMIDVFQKVMAEMQDMTNSEEKHEMYLSRGPYMLEQWYEEWGKSDIKNFDILAVEETFTARLPNGFTISGRMDLIYRDEWKIAHLMDTKTSSFSITLTANALDMGDQPTNYLYIINQVRPEWKVAGLIPDIMYWNKETMNPKNLKNVRTDEIIRSRDDLEEYEGYTMDTLIDIANRVEAVEAGRYHPVVAFGRRTSHCFSYHSRCEYADICRTKVVVGDCPEGFVIDPWLEREKVLEAKRELPVWKEAKDEGKKRRVGRSVRRKVAQEVVKVQVIKRPVPGSLAWTVEVEGYPVRGRRGAGDGSRCRYADCYSERRRGVGRLVWPTYRYSCESRNCARLLLSSGVLCRFSPERREHYLVGLTNGRGGKGGVRGAA